MTYGYLSHVDPLTFDPNNPLLTTNGFALFLAQVSIIIVFCQLLGKLFHKLGQPAVVGELLAGILLGPTALGNVPGFTQTIIPTHAMGLLKLMATLGLSFFLFLVGLETDVELMARYWKRVAIITLPGMAIPFGIAVGIARLIYQIETDQTVKFTSFFLFVGTVMAVSSLSIICRILAEMRILSTPLGTITVAVGVCNDLIGYMLLALGSALASGGKQINALYQLLAAAGYISCLWFVFRPSMNMLIRKSEFNMSTDSHQKAPEHLLAIALVGALVSAFFTDSVGVHPIVGAFAFGVCCPHGNFAVRVTESIETLVMSVLLPLFFVTSGLSTDFKLLDSGTTWGLILLLFCGTFVSKFGATALFASLTGLSWRHSVVVASLMQSKGVIEVIILNVALQLDVVSKRVFAMLVICFLCTTLTVKPVSTWMYSSGAEQQAPQDVVGDPDDQKSDPLSGPRREGHGPSFQGGNDFPITIAVTSLNPAISAMMSFISMVGTPGGSRSRLWVSEREEEEDSNLAEGKVSIDLLRLLPIEYTTSSIMKLISSSEDRRRDDLLESLKVAQALYHVPTSTALAAQRKLDHETLHGLTNNDPLDLVPNKADSTLSTPLDTFSLPSSELIPLIAKFNRLAQVKLKVQEPLSEEEESLGKGMAIVSWQSSKTYANGLSWLGGGGAAVTSGAENENDTEQTFWKVDDDDAHALPTKVFKGLRRSVATGVLIDRHSIDQRRGAFGERRVQRSSVVRVARERREKAEAVMGIPRTTAEGKRILLPFFGGADDRCAVELLKKLVSTTEGNVEGVVLVLPSSSLAVEAISSGKPIPTIRREGLPLEDEEEEEEEENHLSINLKTIHKEESEHIDARFLFKEQQKTRKDLEIHGDHGNSGWTLRGSLSGSEISESAEKGQEDGRKATSSSIHEESKPNLFGEPTPAFTIRTTRGVHFVTVHPPSSCSDSKSIRTLLSALLPVVDPELDLVMVGRGKLGQRSKEFRSEVEIMHGEHEEEEEEGEILAIGRTCGAVTEGLLVGGLRADLLVVQSKMGPT